MNIGKTCLYYDERKRDGGKKVTEEEKEINEVLKEKK